MALAQYEASLSEFGFPIEDVLSVDADPSNRKGTHYFKATSRLPWDSRAVEDARRELKDDPYAGIRQWTVEKVTR